MLRRWVVPPVLLAGMAAGSAGAQVTTTGNIRVVVTDQDGLAVPGATVTAAAEDAATTRVVVTDIRGEAELAALNPSTRYVVTVELQGFQTSRQEDFLVRAGQTASARVTLTAGNVTETVVVTAASPVVDVTSAVVAEDITLDLTEAVPTGRTYQSYLQLVPGVFPDDPESPGNPASKSGLNYSDIGGNTSVSRTARSTTSCRTTVWLTRTATPPTWSSRASTRPLPAGDRSWPTRRGSSAATAAWSAATRWSPWTAWTSSAASRTRRISSTTAAPDVRTLEDEQLGGFGLDDLDQRDTVGYKGTAVVQVGRHAIHGGVEFMRNTNFRDTTYDGGLYVSLSPALSGLTAGGLIAGSVTNTQFDPTNSSDYTGFIRAIDGLANRAEFYALYDGNRDGTITQDELGASLAFDATAGNPHGAINYDRLVQTALGSQQTRSDGLSVFVQDTFNVTDNLSFNLGARAERFEHVATDGSNVFTFDWTFAPRLSVSYDPSGSGQQRISAYYGRYYDPIRNNLTNFAGTLSGSTREEQVYANDQWVTYRVRGGPQQADALFAPTTKTPWTDDVQLSYETDLGRGRSFMVLYTQRRTRDIIEDYDLALYAFRDDGTTTYPGSVEHPDSLFLGLDYFGYDSFPESNFIIATLAGGRRDYQGVEFTFRQRLRDNWQALAAYTYGDATGNTNSDSNADFQGDVIWLDPRAPHQVGVQPGSIAHLFKVSSSYTWDPGFQIGGNWRWNSGTVASRTFRASGRNLPLRVATGEEFEYAGITRRWLAPAAVGTLGNPAFGIVDIRLLYNSRVARSRLELFADIFNLFDNQDATRNQDLLAGAGGIDFGDGIRFTSPRRVFLGLRLNF